MYDVYDLHVWKIDWDKITNWEDLKAILQCCDLEIRKNDPKFADIKQFCKLVDREGNLFNPAKAGKKEM